MLRVVHQLELSAEDVRVAAPCAVVGTAAPAGSIDDARTTRRIGSITAALSGSDDSQSVSSILRAASFALIAFQIGCTVLDGVEHPGTFQQTLPLDVVRTMLGVVAFMVTLSPLAMRNWQPIMLVIYASILATTAWTAAIYSDSDVLVASILLCFLGASVLFPWNTRWQAALEAAGAFALFGYSMTTADPISSLPIAWMMVVSAALVSQLSAVHNTRNRQRLAEQMAALAESARLLRNEIALRVEIASARELDHVKLQASETMLRKMFEASPDNIAINSMTDGRFIAVSDLSIASATPVASATWK